MYLKTNPRIFLIFVTLMSSISLFATDIYLPALPNMAVYFHCSQSEIQASFTVFLLGLAVSQLVAGMISDHVGRKRVLILGFSLLIGSSFACAYSTTLSNFILFRFLQAVGSGVGSTISRALVVDRYDQQESAKTFAHIFPVVSFSGAIAPVIGGYFTYLFGWPSLFVFVALVGCVILFLVFVLLEDDKGIKKVDSSPRLSILQKHRVILSDPMFVGYVLIICAAICVFRIYNVESPFIFSKENFLSQQIGTFYLAIASTYILGNFMAGYLMRKISMNAVLKIGFTLFIFGGILMVIFSHLANTNPLSIIVPMSIVTLGNGFLYPVASAGAMTAVSRDYAGTASGLLGASGFITSALCVNWVGEICHGEANLLSLFVSIITLLGFASYTFLVSPSRRIRQT